MKTIFKDKYKLMALATLLFTVLGCVRYFIEIVTIKIRGLYLYEKQLCEIVAFPSNFHSYLSIILEIAVAISLVLLLFGIGTLNKSKIKTPVILGIMTLHMLMTNAVLDWGYSNVWGDMFVVPYDISDYFIWYILPSLVICYVAFLASVKGFSMRYIVMIYAVLNMIPIVMLFTEWNYIIRIVLTNQFDEGYIFTGLSNLAFLIGKILFNITLILYAYKEKIPNIRLSFIKMTTAQELVYLSERLELGEISEEEYKQKRTEIISKL